MVALRTEITPETVEFKSRTEKQTVFFDIKNTGEGVQMYKIKTTNASDFKIKPVYFSIEVKEKRRVTVMYLGKPSKPVSKDRITIVYGHQLNLKTTVEQAWEDQRHLAGISVVEKRKFVKIAFKDEVRRPDDSGGAQKSVMNSVMSKTIKQPVTSQMSGINRDQDSYFAVPEGGPAKIKNESTKKKGSSRMDPETVTEEGKTEDGGETAPPPPKTKKTATRRKVAAPPPPPPEEEEEEAPPPPPPPKAKKAPSRRKVQAPPPEEEEEAPRAPVKTRKPQVQKEEEEEDSPPPPKTKTARSRSKSPAPAQPTEEEEETPPPPSKMKKPATRRKTQSPAPPPPAEEEEPPTPSKMKKPRSRRGVTPSTPRRPPAPMVAAEDEATDTETNPFSKIIPVTPTKKTTSRQTSSNQKPKTTSKGRHKDSGGNPCNPIESLIKNAGGPVVVVLQQPGRDDEEEEESEKKTKKKSKGKKKTEEDEED